MDPFGYYARAKSNKSRSNNEMHKNRLFLKAERTFTAAENFPSNNGVLGENVVKDTPPEWTLRNEGDRISALEDKIINTHSL